MVSRRADLSGADHHNASADHNDQHNNHDARTSDNNHNPGAHDHDNPGTNNNHNASADNHDDHAGTTGYHDDIDARTDHDDNAGSRQHHHNNNHGRTHNNNHGRTHNNNHDHTWTDDHDNDTNTDDHDNTRRPNRRPEPFNNNDHNNNNNNNNHGAADTSTTNLSGLWTMTKPRLTIGIATHNDFDGLYFSLNALRMYVPNVSECELIVVDNAPDSRAGQRAQGLIGHINAGRSTPKPGDTLAAHSARWIPFGEVEGTAAPRQKIFDEAAADWVLVMDSHVLLHPMALPTLFDYMDRCPDSPDLISGPMMLDNHRGILTQFDDVWRDGMWGTWGHDPRGEHADFGGEFEIPAMGLGLFACRRDAWLKFNPHFREFGGEEFYIHTKFRQAGHRCLCLPMLRWQHRFGDPEGGRKSPLSLHGKVRNYILGHQELGIPLDRLRRHYVEGINEDTGRPESRDGRLTALQFDTLARMPETYPPVSCFI